MRKLKIKLGDNGDIYIVSTLNRKLVSAVQKRQRQDPTVKELQDLARKSEEEPLTEAEEQRMEELQEIEERELLNIIRMSLAKNHKEFEVKDDTDEENGELNAAHNRAAEEKLDELIDMRDLSILSQFALTGTVPADDEVNLNTGDIDLT